MFYIFSNSNNIDILKKCNKETFILTKNIKVFKCLNVNNSKNCRNLENFTNYYKLINICINNNTEFNLYIYIIIIICLIISLNLFLKNLKKIKK